MSDKAGLNSAPTWYEDMPAPGDGNAEEANNKASRSWTGLQKGGLSPTSAA